MHYGKIHAIELASRRLILDPSGPFGMFLSVCVCMSA